jgi:hypothetical protein
MAFRILPEDQSHLSVVWTMLRGDEISLSFREGRRGEDEAEDCERAFHRELGSREVESEYNV